MNWWKDWIFDTYIAASLIVDWMYLTQRPKDIPKFLMNSSRAWIVEVFVPEGTKCTPGERSRFKDWRIRRSLKNPGQHVYDQGTGRCIFCKAESHLTRPQASCNKAPYPRREHWHIIRDNSDPWEDVRRRDRMVLEDAMKTIRTIYLQDPNRILRIRNLKTDDIIMGAILCSDIPQVVSPALQTSSGMQSSPWIVGQSTT